MRCDIKEPSETLTGARCSITIIKVIMTVTVTIIMILMKVLVMIDML